MIQKGTYTSPADNCGAIWIKVFHLYYGYSHKIAHTGDFFKGSVRETIPDNWLLKKTKVKGIIVRTAKQLHKPDGSHLRFDENAVVLLKKRMTTYGGRLMGPVPLTIRRRKFLSSFPGRL